MFSDLSLSFWMHTVYLQNSYIIYYVYYVQFYYCHAVFALFRFKSFWSFNICHCLCVHRVLMGSKNVGPRVLPSHSQEALSYIYSHLCSPCLPVCPYWLWCTIFVVCHPVVLENCCCPGLRFEILSFLLDRQPDKANKICLPGFRIRAFLLDGFTSKGWVSSICPGVIRVFLLLSIVNLWCLIPYYSMQPLVVSSWRASSICHPEDVPLHCCTRVS